MKKKILPALFVSISLAVCLAAGVSSFFGNADASVERREDLEPPSFIEDGALNGDFDSELSDYLTERTPLRGPFLNAKTKIMTSVFKVSPEDGVIIGKNDWLYFKETAGEYTGEDLLSPRVIFNISDALKQIEDFCESNKIDFVFTVAPDKNTLYPENMPARYIKSDVNNFTVLSSLLKENGLNFVDFSDLNKLSDEPLYYKYDTHWNRKGALIAYNRILDGVKRPHETYENAALKTAEKTGDLSLMLYPGEGLAETEDAPDVNFNYRYKRRLKSEEDITIETVNDKASGSLLMFRDSFTNALLPYLAENFNEAAFLRSVPCDFYKALKEDRDVVIYEIAERNIKNIAMYAPIFPSPEVKNLKIDAVSSQKGEAAVFKEDGELTHYYGYLSPEILEERSKIYILLEFPDGVSKRYMCQNIYEKDKLGGEEDGEISGDGFSVYLDLKDRPDPDAVSIIVSTSGKTTKYEADLNT